MPNGAELLSIKMKGKTCTLDWDEGESANSGIEARDMNVMKELVIARVKAIELQIRVLKDRLSEETKAIPKAKRLVDASLRQRKILQNIPKLLDGGSLKPDEPTVIPKEKKSRGSPPLWYITTNELDSLSSYMRGRLTLEKVNAAINDMATYAKENAQIISATKKKLAENLWERALELRDIATTEPVKRKHFFLVTDMKGLALKFDNTGKAILIVLRH
ncbi:hypothetical protein Pint_03891 [Pistacia integerrima]|uniref:Uncharacterized protein n=1 Tax=Pistacia integerrima TaxID=434235 RepID=A0ACC0Z5W9_9ROSI|nr:hypothetical protein Pint_03891 [Pistacia integerrima]